MESRADGRSYGVAYHGEQDRMGVGEEGIGSDEGRETRRDALKMRIQKMSEAKEKHGSTGASSNLTAARSVSTVAT